MQSKPENWKSLRNKEIEVLGPQIKNGFKWIYTTHKIDTVNINR